MLLYKGDECLTDSNLLCTVQARGRRASQVKVVLVTEQWALEQGCQILSWAYYQILRVLLSDSLFHYQTFIIYTFYVLII